MVIINVIAKINLITLISKPFSPTRSHLDPTPHLEGVLSLDPNYVQSRNVYVQIVLQFRFGREDDESMGYSFLKTLYIGNTRVYPPVSEITPTEIQVRGASLMQLSWYVLVLLSACACLLLLM